MSIINRDLSGNNELQARGPDIEVRIYPPKIVRDSLVGEKKPLLFVSALALIDTGATRTSIDRSIAEKLNLLAHDEKPVLTPSGGERQPLYHIGLHIPTLHSVPMMDLSVFGAKLAQQPHQVLIGRDILSIGTLIYSGWKGRFEFCA